MVATVEMLNACYLVCTESVFAIKQSIYLMFIVFTFEKEVHLTVLKWNLFKYNIITNIYSVFNYSVI